MPSIVAIALFASSMVSSTKDLEAAMRQNNTNVVFDLTATVSVCWPCYPYIAIEDSSGAVILNRSKDIRCDSLQAGDVIRTKGHVGPIERIFSAAYAMSIEILSKGAVIAEPVVISFEQFHSGRYDARRIQLHGHVMNVFVDELDRTWTYLVLSDGSDTIYVALPTDETNVHDLIGCKISIMGLCNPNEGGARHHVGRMLIAPNKDAIQLLSRPCWWTTGKLLVIIGILSATLLIVLLWNATLRLVVERRSHELFREKIAHVTAELRTDERTRLAVELHDSLAQNLTGISFQINAAQRIADAERHSTAATLALASKTLQSCREELRNCLWDLRNQALDEPDVNTAIRKTLRPYLNGTALTVRFNVPRAKISDNTLHALLRIIRELVSNAIVHGQAKNVWIAGGLEKKTLMFSVRDDGCGFDPNNIPGPSQGHLGLQGIRERIRKLSGTLRIDSAPGEGSKITVSVT